MALPTVASVVSSGLASYPSIYFDRVACETIQPALAMYGGIETKTLPDKSGVVLQMFDHSTMAANVSGVTEGTPFAGQAVTQNTRQITLTQYADYISVSDKVEKTQLIDQGAANAKLLAQRGALSVDNLILAVINTVADAQATTRIDASLATTYMSAALIRQSVFSLRAVNTPPKSNGLFYAVTHSLTGFDLINDSAAGGFQDLFKYTDGSKAALASGLSSNFQGGANRIATIGGAEVFESNNMAPISNFISTSTGYPTYVLGGNAVYGASLGKTQLGQKNFGVEYRKFEGGNSLDPAGLIRSAVVYNFFFGAAIRPGTVYGFRRLKNCSSIS